MEVPELREIQREIGLDTGDLDALRAFYTYLLPYADELVEEFCAKLLHEPRTRELFSRGDQRFVRLREGFRSWLESLFISERDDEYLMRRIRIGAGHGERDVNDRYVHGALSRLRVRLINLGARAPLSRVARDRTLAAICRALDLDAALILAGQRERLADQLRSHERLSSVGLVSAGLVHDLRNPLATLETSLFLAMSAVKASEPAELDRHLRRMDEQLAECTGIVGGIAELARGRPPPGRWLDCRALVEEAIANLERPSGVSLETEIGAGLRIYAHPVLLRQVLQNLLRNAVQAVGAEGRIRLEARQEDGGTAVRISDTGPGVPTDARRQLFEQIFTTKSEGIGVGLLLCRRILESHGGSICLEDVGSGACFRAWLPGGPERPD